MVLYIQTSYKILPREETNPILRTIEECGVLTKAYDSMYLEENPNKDVIEDTFNEQILNKVKKCFRYYNHKYGMDLNTGVTVNDVKEIQDNLGEICYQLKSWE